MEDHPIMFLFLIAAWAIMAVINIVKITFIVIFAIYKIINKKFNKKVGVNNNVVNR